MLLTVKQRLLLLNILPSESDYITLKVIMAQQDLLGFSDEELQCLKVKREGDMYTWDESIDKPVDIEISESARGVIKQAFRRLNGEGQLKAEFLPLYEHFIEGEEWSPDGGKPSAGEARDKPTPIRSTKEVMGSRPAAEGSHE